MEESLRTFEPGEERAEVERNVRAYRKAHRRYESAHGEIFNRREQARLRGSLQEAVAAIRATPRGGAPRALDLGCGTGNLTAHMLDLGLEVVAADVSPDFLRLVERRFRGRPVETVLLNGIDLEGIRDHEFDLVAAYSVLHHIPNYLSMIAELHRVLRSGGILYLDHEVNEQFWAKEGCLKELQREVEEFAVSRNGWWNPRRHRWQRFLVPSKYVAKVRTAIDPDWWWKVEGDIHTWEGDHIEWHVITDTVTSLGAEVTLSQDYLVYRPEYPDDLYENYRENCSDMRVMAFRKD
jgi:SAM-dependent methyltransferase